MGFTYSFLLIHLVLQPSVTGLADFHLLILSESIDMQLFIFLALLPLHVSAPCSHLQVEEEQEI
jgi:hypothetical protein